MSSLPRTRKHRSSTSRSNALPIDGLAAQLESIISNLNEGAASIELSRQAGQRLTTLFRNQSDVESLQDHFRRLHGFQALINSARRAVTSVRDASTSDQIGDICIYLAQIFHILLLTLRDHEGNRRYFARRASGGGWQATTGVVAALHHLVWGISDQTHRIMLLNLLLQSLANLAMDDDTSEVSFGSSSQRGLHSSSEAFSRNPLAAPEAITLIVALARPPPGGSLLDYECLDQVLVSIGVLARSRSRNTLLLASSALVDELLEIFEQIDSSHSQLASVESLIGLLLNAKIKDDKTGWRIFTQASKSDLARQLLEKAVLEDSSPQSTHFDLSYAGHSALEVPSLPRSFPPPTGYTLSMWTKFEAFDGQQHTTLFGVFDATQTCFVLAYLERGSQQLILQTSVTASHPSVRFKRLQFDIGKWYHITLVHRPPKSGEFGEALLFLNGRYLERKEKCLYPSAAPYEESSSKSAPFPPESNLRYPVQAFFGTPQALSAGPKGTKIQCRWSLATAHLFDCCLNKDVIAIHHSLGPGYSGNFQDRVGSLLTYDASAALNRYNEELYGDKAEKSGIALAIKKRGIEILHEGSQLLSFSSDASINTDGDFADCLRLTQLLTSTASKQLQSILRAGNTVIPNAYRPLICDALARPSGVGVLTGKALAAAPQNLSDAAWKLCGFLSINISLLESAVTAEAFLSSLQTMLRCIDQNFRASDAMERDHGYSIVAIIIREKLGIPTAPTQLRGTKPLSFDKYEDREKLIVEAFREILRFVGVNLQQPHSSILKNPLAYRSFLTDFDTWRTGSVETQKLFFEQITALLVDGPNRAFNARRLDRMGIVRKYLEALRSGPIHETNLQTALQAFSALFAHAAGRTDHRDVAVLIGYCLQEGRLSSESTKPTRKMTIRMEIPDGRAASPPANDKPKLIRRATGDVQIKAVTKGRLGSELLKAYADFLCDASESTHLRRFCRNVPTSWLLHLTAEDDSALVADVVKIIARCIVVMGDEFLKRLVGKTGEVQVLQHRLKSHWSEPRIWIALFAAWYGIDISSTLMPSALTTMTLLQTFPPTSVSLKVPECLPWLLEMLEAGVSATTPNIEQSDSSSDLMCQITAYLMELHRVNFPARDVLGTSHSLRKLLRILYPFVADAPLVSPTVELASLSGPSRSTSQQAIIRPRGGSTNERPVMVRSGSSMTLPERTTTKRIRTPRRPSSFVLVDPEDHTELQLSAHFQTVMAPISETMVQKPTLSFATDHLLDLVVAVLIDHACLRKDFSGFGLFFKAPPGEQANQAYFESFVLRRTMEELWSHLSEHQQLLQAPRTLTNMARYSLHMAEAVFEGWFVDGAQALVDFTGKALDYVQQPEIATIKDVRLCSQAVNTIRTVFLRIVLLRLSELDESKSDAESVKFLQQLTYWQTILFAPENQETPFIRLICYVLYTKLVSNSIIVRAAAAGLFRMLLVQKPTEAATILVHSADADQKHLSTGFMKLAGHDDDEFLAWIDERRSALDHFFLETLSKHWEEFVETENQKTEESAKTRLAKRREKLKQWQTDSNMTEEILQHAERATNHWRINSHAQERMKLQRTTQDQQENILHQTLAIVRQLETLKQPCGLFPDTAVPKWQLDQTEARDRMRMRVLRDSDRNTQTYLPKRKASERLVNVPYRGSLRSPSGNSIGSNTHSPMVTEPTSMPSPGALSNGYGGKAQMDGQTASPLLEGDFELVDDPREDEEVYEDKNRKILRSVERGDSIKSVFNMSRVVGLEACEGLLIIGRKWLYMRDGMFHRSDGEIVSINNAPLEERDAYVQMISGREVRSTKAVQATKTSDLARSWSWREVLSISKRRFLFRDVAIELFFTDGRSYLLILISPEVRNSVYADIAAQAPHIIGPSSSVSEEDQWRLDCLRSPGEVPQTIGNKFVNVFNSSSYSSATRRWIRGEISNFHYLMLVNTMAGRTFNDLTQYPVFPWVLADYSSAELDLEDPRSYRDLRKPMGCQHADRESDFRERYKTFAEMGDERPFHYGTHYSSAMIVTSYLIRLQPFTQSYLLLQGGSFDHADRLFDSIERAWNASSKQNMTDVRELTPEFFYLPEFLCNMNGYDFGVKEGSGQVIGDVHLPKWAMGDPHLFVRRHREALESPFVSEHLHEWIDLVFGYKQKGEAALEAVNVFHPLSYHGAKDLDTIDDPIERLATVGMIHNFGQTPHQVFTRPHPRRETDKHTVNRLDSQAETLTRLPKPTMEDNERIASILYQPNAQKVIAAGPCKLFAPPHGRFFVQWLYSDKSLRFFDTDSRKLLGLYEELHIGPISTAQFLDSKTLLTGGTDSTIGIFDLALLRDDQIDLRPRQYLHGHRSAITHLSASRTFSTLVSADADGKVIVWDLNRGDCIRILRQAEDGETSIDALRINNLNGQILLVTSAGTAQLYTLNGHKLLDQHICDPDDRVTCAAFYEGVGAEWVKENIIFTGHKQRGIVKVWRLVNLDDGAWYLLLIKVLGHADPAKEGLVGYSAPAVTAVTVRERSVYVGDENGSVWEWNCVVRQGR